MASFGRPSGSPGTLTWLAKRVGVDPYQLALTNAAAPGQPGHQARFYLSMMNHQRLRHMALAAAAAKQPTA